MNELEQLTEFMKGDPIMEEITDDDLASKNQDGDSLIETGIKNANRRNTIQLKLDSSIVDTE